MSGRSKIDRSRPPGIVQFSLLKQQRELHTSKQQLLQEKDEKINPERPAKPCEVVGPFQRKRILTKQVKRFEKELIDFARRKTKFDDLRQKVVTGKLNELSASRLEIHSVDREYLWVEGGWMYRRGKVDHRQAKREQFCHMRKWFGYLDNDKSGGVGADDLLDPLVSLGLAQSREDVANLIQMVTPKGSSELSFEDFVGILQSRRRKRKPSMLGNERSRFKSYYEKDQAKEKMANLFQSIWDGKLGNNELSFPVLMTAHRRKMLFNANCAPRGSPEQVEGSAVLESLLKVQNSRNKQVQESSRPRFDRKKIPQLKRKTNFKMRKGQSLEPELDHDDEDEYDWSQFD